MKRVLCAIALTFLPVAYAKDIPSECRDTKMYERFTLKQHINCIGAHLEVAFQQADEEHRQQVADHLQDTRFHLRYTIGLKPQRIDAIPPVNRRLALLEYQQLNAEAIVLVSRMENRILTTTAMESPRADLGLKELADRLQFVFQKTYQKYGE